MFLFLNQKVYVLKSIYFKSVHTIQYNFQKYRHKDWNESKSLPSSSPLRYFDKK